jgi:hypothetical protein
MARVIPPLKDEPTIKVFDTIQELTADTGYQGYHGIYDPKANMILATADSLPHEIGHYRDYRSGRMRIVSRIEDPLLRAEARLRNEIVAIMFAYAKVGEGGTSLEHEYRFLQWIEFMRKGKTFGPHCAKKFNQFTLGEMQDFAEWLVMHEHPWFSRLEYMFRSYLTNEMLTLTYGA